MRPEGKPWKGHMTTGDAIRIIEETRPEQAVLTHLGLQMLFRGPSREAKLIQERTGVLTVAGTDEMRIIFGENIKARTAKKNDQQNLNEFF